MNTVNENQELLEQYSDKNPKNPVDVPLSSNEKIQWLCRFGHKWTASPNKILQDGKTCPPCKQRITLIKKKGSFDVEILARIDSVKGLKPTVPDEEFKQE